MRKLIVAIFRGTFKKDREVKVTDQKQELLIKLGREQFQKLIDRGLSIPVMML